jgi:hypothetical protein
MRINSSVTSYALVYRATLNPQTRQVEKSDTPIGMVGPHHRVADAEAAAKREFKFGPTEAPYLASVPIATYRKIEKIMKKQNLDFAAAWSVHRSRG